MQDQCVLKRVPPGGSVSALFLPTLGTCKDHGTAETYLSSCSCIQLLWSPPSPDFHQHPQSVNSVLVSCWMKAHVLLLWLAISNLMNSSAGKSSCQGFPALDAYGWDMLLEPPIKCWLAHLWLQISKIQGDVTAKFRDFLDSGVKILLRNTLLQLP